MKALDMLSALNIRLEELAGQKLEPITVAVLDSGIDGTHPDLADRIKEAYRIDVSEGEVSVIEVPVGENNDRFGHGTGISSIVASIAPNAEIIDIRILGEEHQRPGQAVVEGLRFAVEQNFHLINMSMALASRFAQKILPLCELAYYQGQAVIASKRNMPLIDYGLPAEFSSCISVDSSSFSNLYNYLYQSDHIIEFAAHGENVTVAAAGGGYTSMTGTSFAAPVITGICSLLLGAYPDLRPFELKSLLKAFSENDQL